MLHILLAIAKGIGTVLLIILAILAALIILVLFVPLRYTAYLQKKDGPFSAHVRVSWLFRLLRIEIHYREKTGKIDLLLFGHRLKTFYVPKESAPSETAGQGRGEHPSGSASQERCGKADGIPDSPEGERDAASSGEAAGAAAGEKISGSGDSGEAETAAAGEEISGRGDSGEAETAAVGEETSGRGDFSESESADAGTGAESSGSGGFTEDRSKKRDSAHEHQDRDMLRKFRELLGVLPEKAASLTDRILDGLLSLFGIPSDLYAGISDSAERAYEKACALKKKAGPFVSSEAFSLYGSVLQYLLHLLHCYRPRKISGYLTFGTGRPDWTGKAAGLLYLMMPVEAQDFDLQPDFYARTFGTDMTMSGKIRLNHAVYVLIRLLLSREARTLISSVRHRDGGGKSRKKKR